MRDDGDDQPQALQRLTETIRRAGPAATASYSLVGAILLFGGLGYVVDRWLQASPWGMIGGLMVGLVVGFYQLAMTVWRR